MRELRVCRNPPDGQNLEIPTLDHLLFSQVQMRSEQPFLYYRRRKNQDIRWSNWLFIKRKCTPKRSDNGNWTNLRQFFSWHIEIATKLKNLKSIFCWFGHSVRNATALSLFESSGELESDRIIQNRRDTNKKCIFSSGTPPKGVKMSKFKIKMRSIASKIILDSC